MALTITNLNDVTQADHDAAYNLIIQMLVDAYPGIDPRRGALSDLLIEAESALQAANQENIALALQSMSLAAVTANPAAADLATLTNLASNYFVTPTVATPATGMVTIVVSALIQVTIAQGDIYTDSSGNNYSVNNSVTARTSQLTVTNPTDQVLTASGANWVFNIPVTAVTPGSAGNLPYLATMTPVSPPPNFVISYTAGAFSGGADATTTTGLAQLISTGFAVKSLASRSSIDGLIRTIPGYANCFTSITGFGDQEQIRYHSILPVAFGGRVDTWVRPPGLYLTSTVTKTALLVGTSSGHGIWQITLGRDNVPGFYEITAITQIATPSATSYAISLETRGYDTSSGTTARTTFLPDITTATEADYSYYSTDTFQFIDTDTSLAGLVVGVSTRLYLVAVKLTPSIAAIQELVSGRMVDSPVGDCLIKAAVPVFVTATVTINYPTGSTAPSVGAVQTAAATAVNATGFMGNLPASVITQAIQAAIPTLATITSFLMTGRLRRPDGTNISLTQSGGSLSIVTDPANLVSNRTICFFLDPNLVTVTLVQS